MSTTTQYNPNKDLNARLIAAGASKTVYALVTPETEQAKRAILEEDGYYDMFRGAWTGKQDALHEAFFDAWHDWSKPVVDLDRANFPFYYPTAGASEAIRQIIFDAAANSLRFTPTKIHFFEGEYEGYRAMAEAAGLKVEVHPRDGANGWHTPFGGRLNRVGNRLRQNDLFFISQPSAIDGNVWKDFNEFIDKMPANSVVADITYVGAVPESAIHERFNLNAPAIRNVVFSLSKPFGCYYDRIGGVWSRTEDLGLFANKWFKNLTSLALGTRLLERNGVFDFPAHYAPLQAEAVGKVSEALGFRFTPSDVYILANHHLDEDFRSSAEQHALADYLTRSGKLRLCVTPYMAEQLGVV